MQNALSYWSWNMYDFECILEICAWGNWDRLNGYILFLYSKKCPKMDLSMMCSTSSSHVTEANWATANAIARIIPNT